MNSELCELFYRILERQHEMATATKTCSSHAAAIEADCELLDRFAPSGTPTLERRETARRQAKDKAREETEQREAAEQARR